jgi:hypothetical protein
VAAASQLDQLIDEGLNLYGQGDIDGALVAWQQALLLDPENQQLISYVDYVRDNYDLLMSEIGGDATDSDGVPFAIGDDEDPEYQIEIIPGEIEIEAMEPPLRAETIDASWYMTDDEVQRFPEERELELELDPDAPTFQRERGEISFEDNTREYPGGPPRTRTRQPAPTSDFAAEITPGSFEVSTPAGGFSDQSTGVRERDLGFVKPRSNTPPDRAAPSQSSPPELKRTLRTPNLEAFDREQEGLELADEVAAEGASGESPEINFDDPATVERQRASYEMQPVTGPEALDSLLDELPRPTPAPQMPRLDLAPLRTPAAAAAPSSTRDLPGVTRAPGPPSQPPPLRDPMIHSQPTRELDRPISHYAATRDFAKHAKTSQIPNPLAYDMPELGPDLGPDLASDLEPDLGPDLAPSEESTSRRPVMSKPVAPEAARTIPGPAPGPAPARPASPTPAPAPSARGTGGGTSNPPPGTHAIDIAAPTRDLGLRQPGPRGEDEPTVQAIARSLRTAREDSTRADVVLPFDPIDASSAQILDDIDELSPANETADERTRRRITALFDRATAWMRTGEHDKAVTAVDLALSEDPSSALAQKLIHRNRDTMQNVFAAFLGDLQRQPALAKPLHELASTPISPRAAFLLSRVDGSLSLDEILDVSGMPRLEAFRYLCQLFLRGILR